MPRKSTVTGCHRPASRAEAFHLIVTNALRQQSSIEYPLAHMYPPQIKRLLAALGSLPEVSDISGGIQSLQGVVSKDLGFPEFAALPIGALRRTYGGLEAEALMQFEFRIATTALGWRTLEFLAWFVRDQSRGGESLQLRPFALPPEGPDGVQLGHTLRWHIDLFCAGTGNDLAPQFALVDGIASDLEMAIKVYGAAIARSAES